MLFISPQQEKTMQNLKKRSIFFCSILIFILILAIFIKVYFFCKKLPTKSISLSQIAGVYIINLDRAVERKNNYEKMLKTNFGEKFLSKPIGNEIRLNGVDGKRDIIFENIATGEKIDYNKAQGKEKQLFSSGIYKVYDKNDPYLKFFYSKPFVYPDNFDYEVIFNKFGCTLSHIKALKEISKQPKNTYGLILEDDFLIEKDFYKKMEKILSEVPNNFDMLKLSLQHRYAMRGDKHIIRKPKTIFPILKSFANYGYGYWLNLSIPDKRIKQFINGNQAYIVSVEGAKKILNYYNNYIVERDGNDVELWFTIPKVLNGVNNYVYLGDMPILLRNDAEISFIDKD